MPQSRNELQEVSERALINAIRIPSLEESLGNSQFDEGGTYKVEAVTAKLDLSSSATDGGAEITQSLADLPRAKVVGGWWRCWKRSWIIE